LATIDHPHDASPPGGPVTAPGIADHLLRVFGLGFGVAVVIGGVIGSGIMRNPGVVAAGFGNPTLILLAWLGGGLFVLIDAMPIVELGSAIPEAGGPYPLAARALGFRWGFLVGWADWLQIAISTGFITVAFGEYVHRLGLAPQLSAGQLAIGLVLACGAVNWIGAKAGGASQDIGSAIKAIGLMILVAALLLAHPHLASAGAAPPPPAFTWAAAAVAMRAIYGAYGGWHAAVYFSEEVHEPQRNVARATFLGIVLVTALYLLVNVAVLHVLPVGVLARSTLAAADAARLVLGPGSSVVVTGLAMVAVATIANTQIMAHTRSTYALARHGMFPPALARVSAGGTPRASLAVVLTATISIILAADLIKGPLYEILLNLYAPMVMVAFLLLSIGVIRLRITEPGLPRPWRMPLFPLPALVSGTLNLALLIFFLLSDWKTGVCSAILLLAAVPIYMFGQSRWRGKVAA
jgi:APA family basic amino acid/polyamine antiporter